MPSVRHLQPGQLEAALRRGGQLEQLLGIHSHDAAIGVVRWLTVFGAGDRFDKHFQLRLHESEDVGSLEYADVSSFPSADPDDEFGDGRLIAAGSDVAALIDAASSLGARADRWVNQGMIDHEYAEARWGSA